MYSSCDGGPAECTGDVPATNGTCLQIITDTTVPCTLDTDCTTGQVCSGNNFCADVTTAYCTINNCVNPATDCDPPPSDATAPPTCASGFCALDCGAGTCPAGMMCISIGVASICA
jgi:hypothetical protein